MNITTTRDTAISKDLLSWIDKKQKGRVLRKIDIMEYTGFSRSTVDVLMNGVSQCGARGRYYYEDVAKKIAGYNY